MFTPYFKLDSTLSFPSVTPAVADGDGNGNVYAYVSGGTIRKVDIANNYVTSFTVSPTTANIGTFAVINGSAVMLSTSSANWELIDLTTLQKTQTALANSTCWAGSKAQQMAANGSIALGTNNGSRIFKFDASSAPFVGSLMTPAWMGAAISTVIKNHESNTFFVGTANGEVREIQASDGASLSDLDLPVTPNDGTAQTHVVTGLSYFSDIMVVETMAGMGFVYQWSTKTLLSRHFGSVNTSTNGSAGFGAGGGGGLTLCAAPSGVMVAGLATDNLGGGTSFQPIFLGSICASGFDFEDYVNTFSTGSKVMYTGVDHTYNKGWAVFGTNSAGNFLTFDLPSAELADVDFRSQFPIGTDITYRNIVIKYNGPGRSRVVLDQNLAAGSTTTQLRKNARYIGISLSGSSYDFRGIDT